MEPKLPSPNDRSINEPNIVYPKKKLIKIYNKETGSNAKIYSPKVKEHTENKAKERGWSNASPSGKNVIFTADVNLNTSSTNQNSVDENNSNVLPFQRKAS